MSGAFYRVDKFVVPAAAREEFLVKVMMTHKLLEAQEGFIDHRVLEQVAGPGEFNFTIAEWENPRSSSARGQPWRPPKRPPISIRRKCLPVSAFAPISPATNLSRPYDETGCRAPGVAPGLVTKTMRYDFCLSASRTTLNAPDGCRRLG